MYFQVDDLRINQLKPLIPPAILMEEIPMTESGTALVSSTRSAIQNIIEGNDERLVVVVGPCSIHDVKAARDYGTRLKALRDTYSDKLEIVMRVYFEKPRTRKGWKGLINDPHLDDSFQINKGLHLARKLLVDLNTLGVPAGCEFLDTISPQFIADAVSWGAIGARTTESQVHRELASGLSMPVGFKNGTDGNAKIAIDAIHAAASSHHFLSVTKQSVAAIVETTGNEFCHVILRGSNTGPNFGEDHVQAICNDLEDADLTSRVMVDCSHGNSNKNPQNQSLVVDETVRQRKNGNKAIFGVMIESNIVAGQQKVGPLNQLTYGQSITDACISWEETEQLIKKLASI
jgi:3-deoxy-7-phosphoheptulonate synthase